MSILFSDIYNKAIGLFDDPKIKIAYENNTIQFNKLMYSYLQNSISFFNNPVRIGILLSNYTEPNGQMQVFEGNGTTATFNLDSNFNIIDNSILGFFANGIQIDGSLDSTNKTVTFSDILPVGQEYSFEQYFPGEFTEDFSSVVSQTPEYLNAVVKYIKDILARLLIISWGENERNFLLDIQNLMTDTDFKISPNSRILSAKNEWLDQLQSEIAVLQNKLSWNIRFASGNQWG